MPEIFADPPTEEIRPHLPRIANRWAVFPKSDYGVRNMLDNSHRIPGTPGVLAMLSVLHRVHVDPGAVLSDR